MFFEIEKRLLSVFVNGKEKNTCSDKEMTKLWTKLIMHYAAYINIQIDKIINAFSAMNVILLELF